MIIAQITDLHIGFDGQGEVCKNTQRLQPVIADLNAQMAPPDILMITGDLVESGAGWAYDKLKETLSALTMPYFLCLGNHDNREAFIKTFGDTHFNEGFLQYTVEDWPVRLIVLDTLEEGRHGGSFCEKRAEWLRKTLAEQPERPTLIALHHPPIETGIGWMTASKKDAWVQRLNHVISGHKNVVHLISGHIHRSIHTKFAGTSLSVSLAVAPQVKLNLAKIDPDVPDDRILLTDSPAGYSLHHWNGFHLTTHVGRIPDGKPVIHYDEKHAFVVRHTMDLGSKT